MESKISISPNKVEVVLDRWLHLQKIIKEEITLNEIITKQQATSVEDLKKFYEEYYKIKLKIRETFENVISIDTGNYNLTYFELSDEIGKILLDVYDPIQKLMFLFRNDFQNIVKLVSVIDQYHQKENISTLVDLFCHQFYENLLIQNPEHEELLILCYLLLEREVEGMNSACVSSFLDESTTFIGKLLKSYTKKQELKTYLTVTLGSLILKIENSAEGCIDLDLSRIANYINNKKQPVKIENKSYIAEKSKSILGVDNENLTKQILKSKVGRSRASVTSLKSTGSEGIISLNKSENPGAITFNLKEGIIINNSARMSSMPMASSSSIIEGINGNNGTNPFHQSRMNSRPSNEINNFNSVPSPTNNNNDFYLELVENVGDLKYEDNDEYNTDYTIEMTQEELSTRLLNETDENMKEFFMKQLERINKNPDIFTNKYFLLNLKDFQNSDKILIKYKENFELIKGYIDSIIKALIDNTNTIPYTLRCICKIIKILIDRKFPDISKYEKNALIGEFIFGKCILPILINSDINAVITSTILSASTKKCLSIIAKVLTRINRGIFFEGNSESNFTIFNHYLIEVIPSINSFYDNLVDVPLPRVLEELINGTQNSRTFKKYNYFKENEDELVNIQCICFSIQDILLLIKILKPRLGLFKTTNPNSSQPNPASNLFIKSVEKIYGQEEYLTRVVKLYPKRNFFLISNTEFNPEKINLLNPKIFRFTFNNEIENNETLLKRIKFCIKLILRGLNLINPRVYSHFTQASSTQNFFIALNQILQLEEHTETEFNDKIPLNWYSLYMTTNLQFLDSEYTKDDYQKLYSELLNEGIEEIGFLNSKSNLIIAKYGLNTRCVEKLTEKINRELIKMKQIEKFMKMEKFIKKTEINVCVRIGNKEEETSNNHGKGINNIFDSIFFWNKRKTVANEEKTGKSSIGSSGGSYNPNFSMSEMDSDQHNPDNCTIMIKPTDKCLHKSLQYLEKLIEGKPEKKTSKGKYKNEDKIESHAKKISDFIDIFGRFKEIKEDIMKGDQRHRIYQSLFNYMTILKEYLVKDELFCNMGEEEIEEILEGIENYIMKKLYKRVYPREAFDKDIEFYEKTKQLGWISHTNLEINKAYLNENLLVLAINCVNKMDEEKSPYDKLKCISSAHKIINNTIKFCSGKDEHAGADDLSPIFQYIILKSQPKRIFSNINFIKSLVHWRKLQGFMGLLLAQIESAAEFILNEINHEKLKMSKEEFEKMMEIYREKERALTKKIIK